MLKMEINSTQKNNESKENVPADTLPIEARSEIVEINRRLKNVEQIVDVVKHVSDKASDSWFQYLQQKSEQAERELQLYDKQHKRASRILAYVVTLVVILCLIAFFKEQYELVKLFIGSSLAVAAGIGIQTLFGRPLRKSDNK